MANTQQIDTDWIVEMFGGPVELRLAEAGPNDLDLTIQFPNRSPVERRCRSVDEANAYVTKVLRNRIATKTDAVLYDTIFKSLHNDDDGES